MPILEDVYDILMESDDTKRMAHILNRLVHGSASSFNQETTWIWTNKYTVLDISELTGDLLTVGMFTVLDYVWDIAKENRTEEKAIFVDEVCSSSVRPATAWLRNLSWRSPRSSGDTAVLPSLQRRT